MKSSIQIDRPLPRVQQNSDAERSVLGAILLDNQTLSAAAGIVRTEDFFVPEHRLIFSRMIRLAAQSQPIDTVLLHEDLARTGDLEKAGGVGYLAALPDGIPRVSNIGHYARIVKQKSLLRQLAHAAEEISEEISGYRGDDAQLLLTQAGERIAALCASQGFTIEPTAWRECSTLMRTSSNARH